MKMKEQEAYEAKADALFATMGWPHSSGDPELGPPLEPLLEPEEPYDDPPLPNERGPGETGGGGDVLASVRESARKRDTIAWKGSH